MMKRISLTAALALAASGASAQDYSTITVNPVMPEIDFDNLLRINDYLGNVDLDETILARADWCECASCKSATDLLDDMTVKNYMRGKNPVAEQVKLVSLMRAEGITLDSNQLRALGDVVKSLTKED